MDAGRFLFVKRVQAVRHFDRWARSAVFYSVSQSSSFPSGNALTDVGAFTNSASTYGTFDQSGNVYQWNDAVISPLRGLRGGSWDISLPTDLQSSDRNSGAPTGEDADIGFRIATVPEPSCAVLLLGSAGLMGGMRRAGRGRCA